MRRILTSVVVVIVALNLAFFLPRMAPGNAAEILAVGNAVPPQMVPIIEQRLGLNQPMYVQYIHYLQGIFLTWPPYLGVSFQYYPEPVSYLIAVRIGWTLLLVFSSFLLALGLVLAMASYSSPRRGGKAESSFLTSAIALHSTPVYWGGMVLLWIFAVTLGWFPIFGNINPNTTHGLPALLSILRHAVLPVVALTLAVFGENYLVLRASVQQVLKSDYVLAAKSRGLRGRIIANRYILRNSLLPLVSLLSFSLASLISRVILVETVFGYPGIGDLIVDGILNRDYPVLEGTFLVLVVLVVVGGLIGDLVLVRLDPRLNIRAPGAKS